MNLNKYFITLVCVMLGFVWLGSMVCAQDSRLYMSVPAQKNAAKSGGVKSGGQIGPLKSGDVYCVYEDGRNPVLFLENAADMCVWSTPDSRYVVIGEPYGTYNDTARIRINTPGGELTNITISVKEGGADPVDLLLVIPRQAAKAGTIIVEDALDVDTTYCAELEYNVRVGEDPNYKKDGSVNNYNPGGMYPTANLRYRWSLSDGSTPIGSELLETPATMYNWKCVVTTYAKYWSVQPKTCENANVTPELASKKDILNVIPTDLTNEKLSIRAIRFTKDGARNENGEMVPGWDTVENDAYRNACVWYSSEFNRLGRGNNNNNNPNSFAKDDREIFYEDESGYVYLQAMPYKPDDISYRHYQYEWIYDTSELYLDTNRMLRRTDMNRYDFGPDKGRVCFKVKDSKKTLTDIKVSFKMHCKPCNEAAEKQSKQIRYESAESAKITLMRIDSLEDAYIAYSSEIQDALGNPVQVSDELPRLCGLTEYRVCSREESNGGQTEYLWVLPADTWEPTDPTPGCWVGKSPAIEETDTKIGDTVIFRVRPANYCFANGGDTSRNGKYFRAFLRSVPKPPIVLDTVDHYRYQGYSKKQLQELVDSETATGGAGGGGTVSGGGTAPGGGTGGEDIPWPSKGVPYPLLLCNNTYFGLNVKPFGAEQSFLLYTPRHEIKPNKYTNPNDESGFVIEFPKADEALRDALNSAYTIEPYKGKELSDTNVLVFRLDLANRAILAGKRQIVMGISAANECGAGNPQYFAINIIDTISVRGHVHDNNNPKDLVYDTLSLCEGTQLSMANESSTDGFYVQRIDSSYRNTDKIEYRWKIPDTWRFDNPKIGPTANPVTSVWVGQENGSVQLALKNRCGTGSFHSGDYIDVNPYTRVNIKVVNGLESVSMALDPDSEDPDIKQAFKDNPFLLNPCRGSEIMYSGDTTKLTDLYRWEFPADWRVVADVEGQYNGTATVVPGHPNWAYTKNQDLTSVFGDMRVRVKVGGDTGNLYVVGQTLDCRFEFDNYAPDFSVDPPWYGHRRDTMKVVVRPFTGKPMQDGAWPDSICVRKVVSLSVKADISQDSLTRNQTHFTWKFPEDYADAIFSSDDENFPQKNTTLTFTVPERTGSYDTITVYSHRYDCDAYNEGDSMRVILKLTDTIPFVSSRYLNDARRPNSRINTTPCEGDTVVYRVLPDPKRYLDSVWFTWNGDNAFIDPDKGLVDNTGWRVLNPIGHYADTLKMIVGRSQLTLGAQAVSPCGMSSVFTTVFSPIGLVRDTVRLVKGRELLCMDEKAVFEWDSVKYATQYEWFYPWGKQHDTIGIDSRMFYREFSRRTEFAKGLVYVRPSNRCGLGPYSDTVKIGHVIGHLSTPTVTSADVPDFVVLRDTLYDTLCLRTERFYEASYQDKDYEEGLEWRYRWFRFSADAQDEWAVDEEHETDSSVYRFSAMKGFEDRFLGVAVHHKECALWGDTLAIRIRPADTVAIDDASLADRLSDWKRADKAIMTRPCGRETAEWHFNSDFGAEKVQYRFVWWDSLSNTRARYYDKNDGSMVGAALKKNDNFTWLNPKEEEDLDKAWYSGDEDVLRVSVPNDQLLYVSVDLKNRCGLSRLPSLAIRTVVSIADSMYGLRMLSDVVCDGDSLVFRVDSSKNIGGFIWHYPWGEKLDTVKVGTQVVRSFNVKGYEEGEVYVVPYNGCGNALESNKVEIAEVRRIPSRAVPVDFDPAYDYARNPVATDTLCMRTRRVLHVRSDSWEEGEYETQWRLVQGNVLGFERAHDSCVLVQNDVNADPFVLEFSSRAKGCSRYSDTLQIRVLAMDTLTFALVEDEDRDPGRLEVLLPRIVRNYADGTAIDRTPCGGTEQKYTIARNIHWSVVSDAESYFSWNAKGEAPQEQPGGDLALGATDWRYMGEPSGAPYRDLSVKVGARDELQLHVNLRNLCGLSHSPALSLVPRPAVTQKPTITPAPICLDAKLEFDCQPVDNAESYHWEFPWEPRVEMSEIPHVEIAHVTDIDGNVTVYGVNGCGKGPADTLKAMVIHTPKAPLPDWNTQGVYAKDADTVTDVVCLHGGGIWLQVRQDDGDAPDVQFEYVRLRGETMTVSREGLITPTAAATTDSSVLLAVYGYYSACGGRGEPLYVRLGYEDTISSVLLGSVLVDPADLADDPEPCPQEEIGLRVQNDIAPAYRWILPATWSFKEGTDTTAASVTVIAGTQRGSIGVSPLTSLSGLGCGSLLAEPVRSVVFVPREVPVTPGFTSDFAVNPCVGSLITYRLGQSSAGNIKAYRWEFPSDWRVPGTDAAVVGSIGDTNVVPVTMDAFCAVIVGKDSGDVKVYAMDSCGERLVRGDPNAKAVYPVDTARLQVLGDQNVCLDSTVYLTVEFLNAYTKTTGYNLRLEYADADDDPLVVEVEDEDSTHLKIRCTNRDTVRMIFTPYNLFACPDNVQPYIHYIVTDTIPEIPGVIEGPSVVCADNPYTYVFHVDAEKKAIFDEIEYSWRIPQGWHIDAIENDTVLHVYFDSVPTVMKEYDTIFCYPVAGCGTAFPTILVLSLQEPDAFNDSIEVDYPDPCIGTELNVWLRDAGTYNTDTIRFIWNTPTGRDADWVRLDSDSLPRTSYRVQYDTASYISVRYLRDHGCGMSRMLTARVAVKDSAAKARFEGSLYPCYTRDFYELAVFRDIEHIDSVSWRMLGSLKAIEHTRKGSSIKNDSLSVANPDRMSTAFSVGVRTFNECGSRDTVFTIRPITTISNFESSLVAPRPCVSDTAYAYIDLTEAQRKQGLFFEWHFVPDTVALSLNEFVAGDSAAVLQYLSGAGKESLQIVLLAGNDCSMLADSMLKPQVVDVVPFTYRISSTYDETRSVIYGIDSIRIEVDSVSVGRMDEYSYTWHPENRLYEPGQENKGAAWAYTKTLVQNPETFSVVSRQRLTAAQEALPFYRRDALCYSYDTLRIRVDSLLSVLAEEEPLACEGTEYLLQIALLGGNYDRLRLDTVGGRNAWFHSISWWRLQDDTLWQEIPEGRNQTFVSITHKEAGNYLYRIIVNDSTVLRDSSSIPVLISNHADTADVWVGIYAAPEIHFTNVSSNPVQVAVGSRIEIDSRIEEGTGYYAYRWSSSPDTSLILPGYEDKEDTRTRALYQRSKIILTVSDTMSGCRSSDTIEINMGRGSDIPNAFTPNGDGKNDVFLKGIPELSIFTRWGEQIFHTVQGEGWDGTHNGRKVRPGDYMYVAVVYENGEKVVFKGVVTVLKVD